MLTTFMLLHTSNHIQSPMHFYFLIKLKMCIYIRNQKTENWNMYFWNHHFTQVFISKHMNSIHWIHTRYTWIKYHTPFLGLLYIYNRLLEGWLIGILDWLYNMYAFLLQEHPLPTTYLSFSWKTNAWKEK